MNTESIYRQLEDQKIKKNNCIFLFLVRLIMYIYEIFNEADEKVIINPKMSLIS